MKKIIFLITILTSLLFLACSPKRKVATTEYIISQSDSQNLPTKEELLAQTNSTSPSDSQNTENNQNTNEGNSIDKPENEKQVSEKSTKVDVDLTKMSATMIYAEVFNMLIDPESYINKTIKMKGDFQVFTNETNTERYYAVVIQDATACCQQGIEFIWEGEHNYPEDYPPIGQEITVTGSYKVAYMDDGLEYHFLLTSKVEY
ncbi:MAG: hypothetical protein K5829_05730 [Treponema sp.]|nr:hypothetical protein [Treponema sp.]